MNSTLGSVVPLAMFLNTIVEKTYPEPWIYTFFVSISCSKSLVSSSQNRQHKFFDWKWPHLLWNFPQKFIRFGSGTLPLLPLSLLFVFLSFQRCVFLSFCLFMFLPFCLFVFSSFCLFIFLSFRISVFSHFFFYSSCLSTSKFMLVHHRVAQIVGSWHPGILAARKWKKNEKMKGKWGENEEMERKWTENGEMKKDSL